MSDPKMVSVTEARTWLDPSAGPKPEVPSPLLVDRYARTIVHQAEQIERLQAALRQADQDAFWESADRYVGPGPLVYEEPDWATYNLHPGDMESTDD